MAKIRKNHGAQFDQEKLQQLKELMRLNPTLEDTAAFFDLGINTIERLITKNFGQTFSEFRQKNMVHTRVGLVRKAINEAMSGNNTMLIFCLKNLCKWSDKVEQINQHSGTIDVRDINEVELQKKSDKELAKDYKKMIA